MIQQGQTNYPKKVKYVNFRATKDNKPFTTFSVSDTIKDAPANNKYANFGVTVWDEHLVIADGDSVIFDKIENISCYHNSKGQTAFNIVAKVTVIKASDAPYQQEQTFVPPQSQPVAQNYVSGDVVFANPSEDSEGSLPFDL